MKTITLMEVKQALRDSRFRETLPPNLTEDLQKYLQNPGCACNMPFYKKLLKECAAQLKAYYPGREPADLQAEVQKLAENNFTVISCHKDELESKLRKLPPGRKQIAICRYEDQITAVVNELEILF